MPPWEKYQSQPTDGPWSKYAQSAPSAQSAPAGTAAKPTIPEEAGTVLRAGGKAALQGLNMVGNIFNPGAQMVPAKGVPSLAERSYEQARGAINTGVEALGGPQNAIYSHRNELPESQRALAAGTEGIVSTGMFGGGPLAAIGTGLGQAAAEKIAPGNETAQLAGGLAGGMSPSAIKAAGSALIPKVSKNTAQLAEMASKKYNIPVSAAQMLPDDHPLKWLGDVMDKMPFSGSGKAKQEISDAAFTRAVSNTFGANSPELTPSVMKTAKRNIGAKFDKVTQSVSISPEASASLKDSLGQISSGAAGVLGEGSPQLNAIRSQIDDVTRKIGPDGVMTGESFRALTKDGTPLSVLAKSSDPEKRTYALKIIDALHDALSQSAPPEMQGLLREARTQYKNYMTVRSLAAKASPDATISPALLRGQAMKAYKDFAENENSDLVNLARIGRTLTPLKSSGTAERLMAGGALMGAGAGLGSLGTAAGAIGASAIGARLLRSRALADAMIRKSMSNQSGLRNLAETIPVAAGQAAQY